MASLLIIRAPVALGFRESPEVRILTLIPFWIIIAKWLVSIPVAKRKRAFSRQLFFLYVAVAGLLGIAFIRTALNGVFPIQTVLGNLAIWVTIALFAICVFSAADAKSMHFRRAVFYALTLYVTSNVVLQIANVRSPQTLFLTSFPAVLLSSIGIQATRTLFPMASGLNSFGIVAGASLVAAATVLLHTGSSRALRSIAALSVISSIYAILLTDSRGALGFALVSILLLLVLRSRMPGSAGCLPLVSPIMPLVIIFSLTLIPRTTVQQLARSGAGLQNLNNRTLIWETALAELSDPKPIHLVGFGYRGQAVSGVSEDYIAIFGSFVDPSAVTTHNFLLQYVFEIGYVGMLLLVLLLSSLLRRQEVACRTFPSDPWIKVLMAITVYMILIGTIEAMLSPDFQIMFILLIYIITATGTITGIKAGEGNQPGRGFVSARS